MTTSVQLFGNATMSADGRQALSWGVGSVQLWDLETGKEIRNLKVPCGQALFLPDGRRALFLGNQAVRTVDLDKGTELSSFKVDGQSPHMSLASDGRILLTTGAEVAGKLNRTLCIWDLRAGKLLHRFEDPDASEGYGKTIVSPDGRHAISSAQKSISGDTLVRILELPK